LLGRTRQRGVVDAPCYHWGNWTVIRILLDRRILHRLHRLYWLRTLLGRILLRR
jgi:hypothetical protein